MSHSYSAHSNQVSFSIQYFAHFCVAHKCPHQHRGRPTLFASVRRLHLRPRPSHRQPLNDLAQSLAIPQPTHVAPHHVAASQQPFQPPFVGSHEQRRLRNDRRHLAHSVAQRSDAAAEQLVVLCMLRVWRQSGGTAVEERLAGDRSGSWRLRIVATRFGATQLQRKGSIDLIDRAVVFIFIFDFIQVVHKVISC